MSISKPGKSQKKCINLELDVREGLKFSTKKEVFDKKVSELNVLSIILGHEGLPVTVKLNKGIDSNKPLQVKIPLSI